MKQIFNFSIPELCQRGDKLVISYKRDESRFNTYGYNRETIGVIESKTALLKEFPSDDYYEGQQKLATDAKNTIRQLLEADISDIRNRIKLVYGLKSIEYSLFNFGRLKDLNDNELVHYALHVVNAAQPRLKELRKRMVTQANLDAILSGRQKLDDAIDEQSTVTSLRHEKKVERNQLANELYQLISELSEVGKLLWKNNNEALYTDYVIYGSIKAMEQQVEELESAEIIE